VVTCQSGGKWSAPAFFAVSGGNLGAKIGVRRTSLVMFALNDAGMNKFLQDKFDLIASAGITTGHKGADASVQTCRKDIVTYSSSP
jgi:lipid-binding SYLF domain-containing protein